MKSCRNQMAEVIEIMAQYHFNTYFTTQKPDQKQAIN